MKPLIARYTHDAHVVCDGLAGVALAVYALLAGLGTIVPANGEPAHWIAGAIGALLVVSQLLRKASMALDKVDPAAPVLTGTWPPPPSTAPPQSP